MAGKKLILSFAAAVALLGAVPASAAEATRETYVAAVEPICKANTEANEKILKGVRGKVKAGKLDEASKRFMAAARALERTRAEILQVPKPAADAARLTRWLGFVRTEVKLFESVGRKLANGELASAQKMVVRLVTTARQANNQVLPLEFVYCALQPSRFV
jgi:hypothetical protein